MMRTLLAIAAATALAACGQTTTVDDTTDDSAAVTEPVAPPPPAVVTITEADARTRAEAAGYTNITGLVQNPDGSWTATGTREGTTTQISVSSGGVTVVTAPAPTP
jgi:hypothetical protein